MSYQACCVRPPILQKAPLRRAFSIGDGECQRALSRCHYLSSEIANGGGTSFASMGTGIFVVRASAPLSLTLGGSRNEPQGLYPDRASDRGRDHRHSGRDRDRSEEHTSELQSHVN